MSLVRAALSVIPRPRPDSLPEAELDRRVTVDRGHLAAYQRVCGFQVSDRLPVTYPHVLGFDLAMALMVRSDFPFPVAGLVHINNRIEQQRQLTADDRLALTVRAGDLRDHPRGRQFDVVTTAEVDGEPVWRDVSTYLRLMGSAEKREQAARARAAGGGERKPEAIQPQAIWRIGPDVGRAYARVSGDHNPIHTSRLGARIFGFPRPIAHGMWSKARCLAALEGRLRQRLTVDVAFKLPILLPAKVGFAYLPAESGEGTGELRLVGMPSGRPHLTGRIGA